MERRLSNVFIFDHVLLKADSIAREAFRSANKVSDFSGAFPNQRWCINCSAL